MWADVFATAAMVMGPAAVDRLQSLVEYDGLVVGLDGVRATSGLTATVTQRWGAPGLARGV